MAAHSVGNGEETSNTGNGDKIECQPLTGQHKENITQNLRVIKEQCGQLQGCRNELYSSVINNTLQSGGDIPLTNICELLYGSLGEEYTKLTEKCPVQERGVILRQIASDFQRTLNTPPNDSTKETWTSLNQCIDSNKMDANTEPVATVCRLKRSNRYICTSTEVHDTTQRFFNKELEQMHCTCVAIYQLEKELNSIIEVTEVTSVTLPK